MAQTTFAPFAYDNEYYMFVDKADAEKRKFNSFMTQRSASYKTAAEEVYNNKGLSIGELKWEAFRENIEPPTPQIKEVDGYEAESDANQTETPDTETPNTGNSDPQNPSTETPNTGNSDPQNPSTENPDTGNSDPQTPSTETPNTGNSDPQNP